MIKIKLLSGPFAGMEYRLASGDTVVRLMSEADIARSAATLAAADNVLLVASDGPAGSFTVRYAVVSNAPSVQLAEQGDGTNATFEDLPLNLPRGVLGLDLAVASEDEPWSEAVLGFVPLHVDLPRVVSVPSTPKTIWRRWRAIALAAGSVALIGAGFAVYYARQPAIQAANLAAMLTHAPEDYTVLPGEDRVLYVFSNDDASASWARRAVQRIDRWQAKVLVREREQARIESWLVDQKLQPVIVRLHNPESPEIVLSGPLTDRIRERVTKQAASIMPYAAHIKVSAVSDETLVALARNELQTLGIASRSDLHGLRTSVSNTVFLDDASLSAMAAYSRQFEQRWGSRRVTVNARLWDDVLRGRSFRYAPGHLFSVGQGNWEYSENLR